MPVWIIAVQWVSRAVLGVLILLSVWSVATMIRCARSLKAAQGSAPQNPKDNPIQQASTWIKSKDWKKIEEWSKDDSSLYAGTVRELLANSGTDQQQDRAVRSFLSQEKSRLENGLTVLATLGSNAPFIGLFGTVLGIIQAFGALGNHQNNTADIMTGISEALIATAIGLFVAIPAVIAFNFFSRELKILLVNAEALKDLFLSRRSSTGAESK